MTINLYTAKMRYSCNPSAQSELKPEQFSQSFDFDNWATVPLTNNSFLLLCCRDGDDTQLCAIARHKLVTVVRLQQ